MPRKKIDWLKVENEIRQQLSDARQLNDDGELRHHSLCAILVEIDDILAFETGRGNELPEHF